MAKVPRWHSVAAVTAEAKARFAVYGWVVAPRVALLPCEDALQRAAYQHRMLAVYWPGGGRVRSHCRFVRPLMQTILDSLTY